MVNLAAKAQQEPLFSNYMLLRTTTNPGYVGATKTINATFCNRTMFAGFGDGKPVTSVFGVDAPFDLFGARSGFGALIVSDQIGFFDNTKVDLTYTYHHKFQTSTLGGGLTVGFNNFSIEADWYSPSDGEYFVPAESDELVPQQIPSNIILGIGFGIYYETPKYYLGFSATNLNRGSIFGTKNEIETEYMFYASHFYLTGTYNIELPDPLFDLQPSFVLRTDLAAFMLDLNGTIFYKDRYWTGFGVRVSPANIASVTLMGGLELINGLNLGYAMDVNTSMMFFNAATSHEVIVTYSFNIDTKRDQKYKSVRYL
ncbi:MAG: PorP/SprF family type IX secretion system membrane protein [Prolixibacteraceae bacterium]|nr:PorP/SprF family type IX secretion system membrane protein [Prolixibacteraceae bacterium]